MKYLVEKFLENPRRSYLKESLLNSATNKKHLIYFTIVDDLQKLFSDLPETELQRLAFINYSYFRGVLLIDSVADGDSNSPGKAMFEAMALIEASLQELAWLIDADSAFWPKYNHSKTQYAQAVMLEKKISSQGPPIDKSLFETIYEGKSATLAYNLIDALDALGKTSHIERVNSLKLLLKHIHLAYQFKDDIDDFKSDLAKSQYTYAIHLVNSSLQALGHQSGNDFKYKYLFTSGIAQTLLQESTHHFHRALAIAQELDLNMFCSHIQSELHLCRAQVSEINALIYKTKVKLSKSSLPLLTKGASALDEQLKLSIEKATEYLFQNTTPNGQWEDFLTSAGLSNYWVTAYTYYHLIKHNIKVPFKPSLEGSFNDTLVSDGDTLTFTIAALALHETENPSSQLKKHLDQWLLFRQPDGGWATYVDKAMLRSRLKLDDEISVAGWIRSKPCVTAAACCVLGSFADLKKERIAAEQYLLACQHAEGFWESYWWTSDIYATSWAIQALNDRPGYTQQCEKALSWLTGTRNHEKGFWSDDHTNLPNPFYTALAVQAILATKKNLKDLVQSIQWLLQQQKVDGSWPSTRILAIPATNVLHRAEVKSWRNSSFGVNTLVDDHNRIFTTVTALGALLAWKHSHS
ncbi:Squalene-hopene cyclase C-terminal domain-containing protein [Chryseolinea serpens]|uniref:Squalene-hopene cyclase C-terminal domain-containing protein n=1 Tax=Chryseolinea serpens TaxID=947013 RepID=A0A1M5LIG6_9BACT|nr:prenyltransferase/squalene oxidase repeat-containing protein [Chryseolinea serpens]SHG64710.1 Squalene-hopene cyclase C-terminal domain-containing protein [Chryseolinea serpens]